VHAVGGKGGEFVPASRCPKSLHASMAQVPDACVVDASAG
jgi:hypothetical protein